jgi:aminoglycoside phosphotransferase family enzyme/predicted kinase
MEVSLSQHVESRPADDKDMAGRVLSLLAPPVERIDTHAAVILLSGDRAFKLKKPVAFSFLDFRTLGARRAALEAELRLNRRTAPELYEAVIPVTEAPDGALALDGPGEPVEWLLVMRRFPEACRLDHVAERGELDAALVDRLAAGIAAFHSALEPLPDAGGAPAMREVTDGNAEDLRRSVPDIFAGGPVERLVDATDRELRRQAPLLEARRQAGFVRHCHGDLHLANIVLLDGRPVLFDCIEFDDAFARTDLLYDLAFLVMDLLDRGLVAEAQALLQGYTDRTEDDAGQALLPLFLSVRAAIRAKVEAFAGHGEPARTYLALALRMLAPVPPRLIAIGGRSGTGKSSVARALAPDLGAAPGAMLLRSDVIRKRFFGRAPTDRLPEEAYTEAVSAEVFERLATRAETLLRAGRTVIADGVFGDAAKRARIERAAEATAVPFHGFWLEAPESLLVSRVAGRSGDASDADLAVVRAQAAMRTGAVTWTHVPATGDVAGVAARLAGELRGLPGG